MSTIPFRFLPFALALFACSLFAPLPSPQTPTASTNLPARTTASTQPSTRLQTYFDSEIGIAIAFPENWIRPVYVPGQIMVFQSYPEGKYLGGEQFQPGDSKCDLVIHPTEASLQAEIDKARDESDHQVLSEQSIFLTSGLPATRFQATSNFAGEYAILITEISDRVISFVCYGSLINFDQISQTIRPYP